MHLAFSSCYENFQAIFFILMVIAMSTLVVHILVGDFFMNMFPILSFATLGTVISALTIGSALYVLGQANLMYKMSVAESFAFGLMISAVDPVATLAIFQALNVQRMLKLFGESILNDVVSIVLTSTSLEMSLQNVTCSTSVSLFFPVISRFTYIFLISALLGAFVGFLSALFSMISHVHFRCSNTLIFTEIWFTTYICIFAIRSCRCHFTFRFYQENV
uniref:Na_H_Exchanger domain-containing protein n=1 Tax=Wuchereria bancrofti TaxID=6293 RepID=A0A1I8EV58_WUCBA